MPDVNSSNDCTESTPKNPSSRSEPIKLAQESPLKTSALVIVTGVLTIIIAGLILQPFSGDTGCTQDQEMDLRALNLVTPW